MKNIVLLGAPGAGKGTQAVLISKELSIPHISTGDIFRNNIKEQTELGKLAKTFMDAGELVPDELVIGLVKSRLDEADAQNGYVLDGFPRTINQAKELDKVACIDVVINLIAPYDIIIERISGRRVCSCGKTYHISRLDGKTDCLRCGKKLFVRNDDKPETIKARLEVYDKQTAPLIDYYAEKGILMDIESLSIEQSFEEVLKALSE